MTALHYDPARVLVLRQRTGDALVALEAISSGDPAAADAVGVLRRAAANLSERWLPVLDRLAASDAMCSWHGVPPGASTGAAARRLAELVRGIVGDEVEDMISARAALESMDADAGELAAFFTALGAGETARLLMRLGMIGDDRAAEAALALAATLRAGLAAASSELGQCFARRLVQAFVDETDDDRRNPAVALSYLLHDATYDTDFLVALTREVLAREVATGEDEPLDGFLLWPWVGVAGPPSILYREFDDADDRPSDEFYLASDPVYAVLDALAGDGVAARAVLTDATLGPYLLHQRNLALDGMRRLAAVGVAAAAGPDVVAAADPALLRAASLGASAFVNLVAARGADVLWWQYANPEVSSAVATILGRHLPAVHFALLHGDTLDVARGDLVPMVDASHGPGHAPEGALFDVAALDVMSALAVDTDDGIAITRTALDLYQADQAAAASRRLRTTAEGAGDLLREGVADAARLEAHFIEHAGHRAEERGRSRDVITSFWIDVATFSIGQGTTAVSIDVPMVSEALGPAAAVAKRLLADHEATAARNATANAEAAADQLAYVWYRELHRAGVITPTLPAAALDGGELVAWEEFQQLSDRDRAIVRSRMEETTGRHGVNLDGGALRDVIKVQQLPIYQQLD